MISRLNSSIVFLSALASIVAFLCTAAIAVEDETSPFRTTTKRADDSVVFKAEANKTVCSIRSPFGISHAVIQRTEKEWPKAIVLRLHLTGLESLRIENGKWTLAVAVSSHNDQQRVRLWKDRHEDKLIDPKNTYWMEIRMLGSDRKPSKDIPLKDGHFEMQLPAAFLEDNPKSITIHWIDFFRG